MARIVYALSGQGRGHTSRVMAISDALRKRGHDILYCCGGTAHEILAARSEPVLPVPPLRQIMEGNQVRIFETLRSNWSAFVNVSEIVSRLADEMSTYAPHLVINDFEAFSHRAAERLGVPVVSFNHQQIVSETRYKLPRSYWMDEQLAQLAIRLIAPKNPEHVIVTSFFFPPVKDPRSTTLVPPIIRPAVRDVTPTRSDHVLVYYNSAEGAEHVLSTLSQVDAQFVLYNFDQIEDPDRYPNLVFKQPSIEEFLADLASSRGVISTAGFTLTSEALYLGKPLLVVPNRGVFEQTLNAVFLEREGLGAAVMDRPLETSDVVRFLNQRDSYERQLEGRTISGNKEAVERIEGVLFKTRPRIHPRPAVHLQTESTPASTAGGVR